MVHPDRVLDERGLATFRLSRRSTASPRGSPPAWSARYMSAALEKVPPFPNGRIRAWLRRNGSADFHHALSALHRPDDARALTEEMLARSLPRRRLAYDELLASQLALALVRSRMRRLPGRVNAGDGRLVEILRALLPFGLTGAQEKAVEDIRRDLVSDKKMLRLLQGDVGSGKTVVGLLAMASAIEAGRQAALMAPTEILARQHFERIAPMARDAGLYDRAADRPRQGSRTPGRARRPGRRLDPDRGRHPRVVSGGSRVSGSRRRGRRRAAPLRCSPAPGARGQGRGRGHSGDDRDPHPAHPGADLFRRHGRVGAR